MKKILFALILLSGSLYAQEMDYTDRENVLTVALSAAPQSLDPLYAVTSLEAQVFTNLHEGLVSSHPSSLEPLPAIADSWTITPDQLTYSFHIRESAKFSNGDAITAEDAKESFLRLLDPKKEAPYASLLDLISGAKQYRTGKGEKKDVGINSLGEYLTIKLDNPSPHFIKLLTHPSFSIIHSSLLKKGKPAAFSGAYTVVSSSKSILHLQKNAFYWDFTTVKMPNLAYFFGLSPTEVTDNYNSGKIHWINDDFDYESLKKQTDVVFTQTFSSHFFYISSRQKPFDNPKVRQALSALVNWASIKGKYNNQAEGLIPAVVPGYPPVTGIPAGSIETALKLLEEAGFPKGEGLPEITIYVHEESLDYESAKLIKEGIEAGTKAKVKIVFPQTDYYFDEEQKTAVISSLVWIADYLDPYAFLELWKSDSNLNYAGYKDDEYDQLLISAMQAKGNDRYKILAEAEKKLITEGVIFPINYSAVLNVMDNDGYLGWFANPLDIHPVKFIQFRKYPLPWGITQLPSTMR